LTISPDAGKIRSFEIACVPEALKPAVATAAGTHPRETLFMPNAEPQMGKYGITVRLFSLIGLMPKNQQLVLLNQLAGDRITEQLFKLIVDMSEEQQLLLLEQMGHPLEYEEPETTISLEGTEPLMREKPRKSCLINANYSIQGNNFKSYILDISIGGVFIETNERVPVGENITLNFSLPSLPQPLTMSGKIAWSGPQGFGVKFESVPSPQGSAIKEYVAIE
jgi:Tfp pilus assembly protein PilZ